MHVKETHSVIILSLPSDRDVIKAEYPIQTKSKTNPNPIPIQIPIFITHTLGALLKRTDTKECPEEQEQASRAKPDSPQHTTKHLAKEPSSCCFRSPNQPDPHRLLQVPFVSWRTFSVLPHTHSTENRLTHDENEDDNDDGNSRPYARGFGGKWVSH